MSLFRLGPHRFARGIHRNVSADGIVDVSETDGVRALHIDSDTIQSAMRLNAPHDLELTYTRGMMMFLLFYPQARKLLLLGLGGGSIPKFVHHYLPEHTIRTVEINPQVITIARSHFQLPDDDARLQTTEADGIVYLREHPGEFDVVLHDAYGGQGLPEELGSQTFFDTCAEALADDGMLVVNLWGSDKQFDARRQRIERSFEQRVLVLPTGHPGNIVVFGFRRTPSDMRIATLRENAKKLQATLKIEFLEFTERLRDHNRRTPSRLLIGTQ
ncbi:MAG: polyamine aminopropyltransferase [Methylobacillus sp.]|jgi:spermidine synthase|nr:polyamine aminopropyltransferase [Methylobacillus sp.]